MPCGQRNAFRLDRLSGFLRDYYKRHGAKGYILKYDIWHMMIDESAQGRGYGNEVLDRVIDYIRTKSFGDSDRVALTCNKQNPIASKLYESKGFYATRNDDEDEIELAMTIG